MDDLGVQSVARVEVQGVLFTRGVLLQSLCVEPVLHGLEGQLSPTRVLEELLHHVELCVAEELLVDNHVDQELDEHVHVAYILVLTLRAGDGGIFRSPNSFCLALGVNHILWLLLTRCLGGLLSLLL